MLNLLRASGCIVFKPNGSLDRCKTHLLAPGIFKNIDYEEIFSPVAKMTIVRPFLAIVGSHNCSLSQMDVKNDFFYIFLWRHR